MCSLSINNYTYVVSYRAEVKNSNGMELESLKRQLQYLEDSNVAVKSLVTDRHSQVSAYMSQEKPHIKHTYDVWHLAKGTHVFNGLVFK